MQFGPLVCGLVEFVQGAAGSDETPAAYVDRMKTAN